jgi:hypothetical protein
MRRLWSIVIVTFMLAACSIDRASQGREVFDEQTGNTLTVVSKPLVFARERSDVAANARDYATVVAVQIDHSGTFTDYLLLYRWSTVDRRMLTPQEGGGGGTLRLISEGRELKLQPLDSLPVGLDSIRILHSPRHGAALIRAYVVDVDTLRSIAASDTLALQLPQEILDTPFHIWEDGRRALAQFVQQTSSP